MSGYKSYILAALGVIYAVAGFLTGHLDANSAIELLGGALSVAALRHGISTTQS